MGRDIRDPLEGILGVRVWWKSKMLRIRWSDWSEKYVDVYKTIYIDLTQICEKDESGDKVDTNIDLEEKR